MERANNNLLAGLTSVEPSIDIEPRASFSINDRKILNALKAQREAQFRAKSADYVRPQSAFEFVREPVVNIVRLSPSGRYVSAVHQSNKTKIAVIYDLDGEEGAKTLNFGNFNIDWIAWANDERLLIGYSLYVKFQFEQFAIYFGGSRVLAVNRDGSNAITLFGGEPAVAANNFNLSTVLHMLPADPEHILMPAFEGQRLGVWRVNIENGDAQLIQAGTTQTGGWFTDKSGTPLVRIDANKRLTYLRLYSIDPDSGKWSEFASGPYNTNRLPNIWPAAASDEENAIYALAHSEDEDRVSMKLLDISTGEFLQTVFAHPQVDVRGAAIDARDGAYMGSWFIEDFYNLSFEDSNLQAHYDGLRDFFGENANVYITSISRERHLFLVYVVGPEDPGDFYTYNYQHQHITPLIASRPNLSRDILGRVEKILYETRDGLTLTSYVTHPAGVDDDAAPLVVMPHGGPEDRNMITFDPRAQFLASRGYRVLQPNFRGSAGFGKSFAEAGYGEWGRKMQNDIDDATHYAIERGWVRDGQICIVGASYGGYAALVGAMKSPHLYRCAVSVSGVSDLPEFLKYQREEDGADSQSYKYWVRAIGHPSKDRNVLIENSPRRNANKITIPIMLAHGVKDNIVPVAQSRMMRDALKDKGGILKYIEFKNAGHSYWSVRDQVDFLNELETFLWYYLEGENPYSIARLEHDNVLITQ